MHARARATRVSSSPRIGPLERLFVWTAGLAILLFVLVHVWLDARADSPTERVKRLMPGIGAELVDQPLTAEQAAWRLETSSGSTITLGQLPEDRLVFLNFWATWCPPCREELPSMLRLGDQLSDRAFMMVAVGYDESWEQVRTFFSQWRGALPAPEDLVLLRDPQQVEGRTLRERFGTTKLPDTYVLYRGRVVARFVNARNWVDPSIVSYFRQLAPPIDAAVR